MNPLDLNQRLERLSARLAELRFWQDCDAVPLHGWTFNGRPLDLGDSWPERSEPVRITHSEITVPADWELERTWLDLDLGGEGLVRIRYGAGEEAFGLDRFHRRLPLRERMFSVESEVAPRLPFGIPNRQPRLASARLTLQDDVVERLARRLGLTIETAWALYGSDLAVELVLAAERAVAGLDWPSETGDYLSRVRQSRQMLEIWELPPGLISRPPGLDERQRRSVEAAVAHLETELRRLRSIFPPQGTIGLSGQAHLDLAWLWPLEETRRKAQRTAATALGLLERFPEATFHLSSAQVYTFLLEDDPALFATIQQAAQDGRWEPIGGMWVEPDLNMPAGESLVRQLLYGQRFFQRHFGRRHTVAWLPDCFGFNPTLPQLLRQAGIDSFFTIKVNWSETNTFPYDLFWWEGLDGSRVLAHTFLNPDPVDNPHATIEERSEQGIGGYNGKPTPFSLRKVWEHYRGKTGFPETLLTIGYGDGGGGPNREMLEAVRELELFPALPATRFTTVRGYFERAHAAVRGETLPVWVGEMYLELHRGTLTTQGRTKYLHRRAERDLVAAETVASMATLLGGAAPASLEPAWQLLLRNEFHDILPGSSIREVYERAERELCEADRTAGEVIERALEQLAERTVPPGDRPGLLLVNPDLSARPVRMELSEALPGTQAVAGGYVLTAPVLVPGLGTRVLLEAGPPASLSVSERHLENDVIRVTIEADGTVASVLDRRANREVLAGRGNQIWAYVDKPRKWDAWDIDAAYAESGEEIPGTAARVIERGPHRAAVAVTRSFRASCIEQEIRLWASSPRLEFKTTLRWHDRRWLLKARFPLNVRSGRATFETAFGVVERATHRNTSWQAAQFEVAAHRFVDLSEPGYGVALLNDGKYGHHALGNELGLSLLRSPIYPDPLADEGEQTFTYALLPHAGSWLEGGVQMEAEDLNRPLLARACRAGSESVQQIISVDGMTLGLGALKPAEDGDGLVLRLYEPQGARGRAKIRLPEGWTLDRALNLLEDDTGNVDLSFSPFQVRTWRLTRR